jgi:ubiquitin C-terminal hydrolase
VQRKGKGKGKQKQEQSNKSSREAAFSLLIELVKKSEVSFESFLENIMTPMLDSVEKPKTWSYAPPSKDGGAEGRVQEYVGLRNLGCICYMNSMMQ